MPLRLSAGARPSDGEKGTTMTGVLDGQVAIVSGAGRGIGLAIAKTLAEAGAAVALVARTEADINTAASTIQRAGGRAMPFAADVPRAPTIGCRDAFWPSPTSLMTSWRVWRRSSRRSFTCCAFQRSALGESVRPLRILPGRPSARGTPVIVRVSQTRVGPRW